MNALALLKQDHNNVEELFRRFETARPDDASELGRVRDLVVEHLSKHATVEEQLFYPAIRARLGKDQDFDVLEALEEHHVMKLTLSELEKVASTNDRFRAKMTVLIESVRHHVEEEENDLFKQVRDTFTVEELNELGERMEEAKTAAPTRSHPFVPDVPPFNIIFGVPLAVIDRTLTAGRQVVGRLVKDRS
ncbi:MAG: hemerythrin domain-containing protein [Actinomycetota bacterium]|nr:hemerythrin domain-containing protein [Actinomycetota bacterium]